MPKNAQNEQKPKPGDLIVNVTPLAKSLVDLAEGRTRGMLFEQPGFAEVVLEIIANQETFGDRAGITNGDFADLQNTSDIIAQIDSYLPAARKLVEILEESRAKYDDHRQRLIYAIADAVERRARPRNDGDTLLAKYQKTREYRSAIARKAVRTRRRNAAQGAETPPESEGPTTKPEPVI